jgi:hypothetical protein
VLAPEVAARGFEGGVWPVVCERAAVDEEMDDGDGEMAPGARTRAASLMAAGMSATSISTL